MGEFDALVMGDVNSAVERSLVERAQLPDVELLVVGHHGSKYSTSFELLEAARAETAVISVGWNNYGHPTYEALRRLEICGLEIYRTDEDGTVTVRTGYDGKESKKAPKQSERLNYGEVSRELKTGGPQRLYLLYGQGGLSARGLSGRAQGPLPAGRGDDFSYHRLDGRTLDMRELEEAVNALPFLSERALTEVRGYDLAPLPGPGGGGAGALVSDIPEYCTLVFVQDSGYEPDQRTEGGEVAQEVRQAINFTSQASGPRW